MVEMSKMRVKLTFTNDLLSTAASNPEIYAKFIASKAPDAETIEDEIAAVGVEGVLEQNMTVFPRDGQGRPFIYDYQIRGFFKDTCGALQRAAGNKGSRKNINKSAGVTSYKKLIDGAIFIEPREIVINFKGLVDTCQRPIRINNAHGENTALVISESIPAGAAVEFDVLCVNPDHLELVREWFEMGRWKGLGQWRNSGKGSFTWEEITPEAKPVKGKAA
jgi:hypothetical protein